MSAAPLHPTAAEAVTPPVQTAGADHRWTVEEYHQLGRAGGFQYGDLGPHETRVELLRGVIVNKYAKGETWDDVCLRWTRDMYERLVERGGLDGLKVELIRGHVLDKVSPQGSPHSTAIQAVTEALREAFGESVTVRTQLPIRALNESEPEPDVAVVAGSFWNYVREHPSAALLVVGVAQTSLASDQTTKLSVYAESGFPEYWIVNLRDNTLEVYRDPQGETYPTRRVLGVDGGVSPLTRSTVSISVADLLP